MDSNIIIIIGSIIVAVIFITWLVRYISGLKKTRDFYQKKVSEMKNVNAAAEAEEAVETAADAEEQHTEKD